MTFAPIGPVVDKVIGKSVASITVHLGKTLNTREVLLIVSF